MDLLACEQDTSEMVTRARLSRDRVWKCYRQGITIRDRLLQWIGAEAFRTWENPTDDDPQSLPDVEADFGIPRLQACFESLLDHLRVLVANMRLETEIEKP